MACIIFPRACFKKFAIFCHRWTGAAFCLLFSWWFISGIFMMYFDFPGVNESDRLARAQPLDASRSQLSAERRMGEIENTRRTG